MEADGGITADIYSTYAWGPRRAAVSVAVQYVGGADPRATLAGEEIAVGCGAVAEGGNSL